MSTATQIQSLSSMVPYFLLHSVAPALGWAVLVIFGLLATLTLVELVQVLALRVWRAGGAQNNVETILLGLTFPSDTTKSAFATEQLYTLLHTRASRRSVRDWLTRDKRPYSLELVSTRDGGIRYVMAIPQADKDLVCRSLLSFLPGLKIEEVEDYLADVVDPKKHYGITELKLSADFILPLQEHKLITEHDTIAYLTGQMTQLAAGELIGFQLVISPVSMTAHPHIARRLRRAKRTIAAERPLSSIIGEWSISLPLHFLPILLGSVFVPLVWIIKGAGTLLTELPQFLTDSHYHANRRAAVPTKPALNPYEIELREAVRSKTSQHLYEATIRIIAVANSEHAAQQRVQAVAASLRSFSSPHQTIVTRRVIPVLGSPSKELELYRRRIITQHPVVQNMVLSSSELSDLYHFPNTNLTKTEGLVKSRSRELPAPLSLKNTSSEFDVVLGVNNYGGEESPIGLTLDQRQKHTYVIGKTGTGKTTMLTSSIYQDMVTGKGLAVLDPHGDMYRELIEIIPEHRLNDVVIFDPSDRNFPVGLNLLAPGVEFANKDDRAEWVTSAVLSVFAKLTDEAFWGPRMEHILRNTTLTALTLPAPNMHQIYRLLTDRDYQKMVARNLEDPILKQFWQKEFAILGDMQLSSVTAPLTHRLGHFLTAKMSRHILLQPASTVRIADIMNQGKILLVNLAKGDLGEDQSTFFGLVLTSLIWMAAYQRTKIPEAERRDFFVYVDEFQNFATPRFSEITSEGRKFRVSLIASHQNIAQIADQSLLKIVAGNASTIVCLKASPSDEQFILPFMQPEVTKGDIVSLAPYQFFMKTSGAVSEDAFSGRTVPLDSRRSEELRDRVIAGSRARYSTPVAEVETDLKTLLNPAGNSQKKLEPAGASPAQQGLKM